MNNIEHTPEAFRERADAAFAENLNTITEQPEQPDELTTLRKKVSEQDTALTLYRFLCIISWLVLAFMFGMMYHR